LADGRNLRKHELNFHLKFACDYCPKRFESPNAVTKHFNMSHELSFSCKLCTEVYNDEKSVLQHMIQIHSDIILSNYVTKEVDKNSPKNETIEDIDFNETIEHIDINETIETVAVKEEEIYELEDEDWQYQEEKEEKPDEETIHDEDENLFLCDFCCFTFDCQEDLVRHMITDHP
jgi:hypothetical protein